MVHFSLDYANAKCLLLNMQLNNKDTFNYYYYLLFIFI